MQNNNPVGSWKEKLEADAAFGEEIINGHAAWDKLYARMHIPRRKKAAWYWAAAAGILFIALLSIFLRPTVPGQNTAAALTVPALNTSTHNPATSKPAAAPVIVKERFQHVVKEEKKIPAALRKIVATGADSILVVIKNEEPVLISTPVEAGINKADSLPLAVVQNKPRLKVVHVNELGENTGNVYDKKISDYSFFPFGTNKTNLPSGKIGIQIITNKTSPSN